MRRVAGDRLEAGLQVLFVIEAVVGKPSRRVLNPLVRNWLWQSMQLPPRRLTLASG